MPPISRRTMLGLGISAAVGSALGSGAGAKGPDLHRALLDEAARQQERRRTRFAAVATKDELEKLQGSLRSAFLELLDGLPTAEGPPPARVVDRLGGDGIVVEKLVFESFPGYFVTALLYRPERIE